MIHCVMIFCDHAHFTHANHDQHFIKLIRIIVSIKFLYVSRVVLVTVVIAGSRISNVSDCQSQHHIACADNARAPKQFEKYYLYVCRNK